MGAYEVANGLESSAVARLKAIYESALRTALRRQHAFLAQIKAIDEGKIKPPQWYVDRGKEKEWREGFTRELLRKNKVIEGIMEDLNAVGGDAADIIREFTCDVYDVTRKETIEILSHEAAQMGVNPSFATYNKRQIGVLIREAQSPFSKLAYENLGKNPAVRRRLQNEMAQAAILGESQQKLVKRIQEITGQLTWQAKRVAQTERTRVQSQARFEAGAEAQALGVKVFHEWSTRMINSRDTHIVLNGKKAMQGEKFPGSMLRFPGDPNAPAREVINCHCVLIPGVLLPDEELDDDGTSNLDSTAEWDRVFSIKYLAKSETDLLKNHEYAAGIRDKLSRYSLNKDHPTGKHKALVFQSALGYNESNVEALEAEIKSGLRNYKAISKGDKGHGPKFDVVMLVKGQNGKKQPVLTSWIIENDIPRMVTAYVEKNRRP